MAAEEVENAEQEVPRGLGDAEEGVLLYYRFVAIPEPQQIKRWLYGISASLGLLGRIRVAPDGINVTVGGKMSALHEHMTTVASNPLFEGVDFKLASSAAPVDLRAAAECGFTTLSARLVKELVTLGLHPSAEPPSLSMAGQHVTARNFHRILQEAAAPGAHSALAHCDRADSEPSLSTSAENGRTDETFFAGQTAVHKKTVVMDVRNLYETRIGRFCPPKGVDLIYPSVRQYSDLPDWINANEDLIRHKQILMCCTGGVRCEMASAYIRSKGTEFEDVLQLSGGIQRYLEAFPDGGYFAGKNFVFDHRLAVPSTNQEVLGTCLTCRAPFDDYSSRCRCSLCRLLVLVCQSCRLAGARDSGEPEYVCELCREDKRTSKLSKPVGRHHSLPCGGLTEESNEAISAKADEVREPKLRILCLHGFRQSASSLKGRLNSLRKKLRHRVELVFIDAPHEIPPPTQHGEPDRSASKRRAWLTSPETDPAAQSTSPATATSDSFRGAPSPHQRPPEASTPLPAPDPAERPQFQTQTEGWPESWRHLQEAFSTLGPFQGVLGFSQGAAVAAALCDLRAGVTGQPHAVDFRFVVLCSGFWPEHRRPPPSPIDCPSLHIFGGRDRQIGTGDSDALATLFSAQNCWIVRHDSGHIIPTAAEFVDQYLQFLEQF